MRTLRPLPNSLARFGVGNLITKAKKPCQSTVAIGRIGEGNGSYIARRIGFDLFDRGDVGHAVLCDIFRDGIGGRVSGVAAYANEQCADLRSTDNLASSGLLQQVVRAMGLRQSVFVQFDLQYSSAQITPLGSIECLVRRLPPLLADLFPVRRNIVDKVFSITAAGWFLP